MYIPQKVTKTNPVREIKNDELEKLLDLYLFLHEDEIPEKDTNLANTWNTIINDPNHHIVVVEADGVLAASCVCVIIPNLTRKNKPYAFIENVVTRVGYRDRGFANACLDFAKEIAENAGCYKMMLLTSSKLESTHDFYKRAGYNSEDKTAYIQWLQKDDDDLA